MNDIKDSQNNIQPTNTHDDENRKKNTPNDENREKNTPNDENREKNTPVDNLLPKQIVAELDRHIVGQMEAKKAVALALRSRWRRQRIKTSIAQEIIPKNILMIGPTGVGKTEISRRIAKIINAPFVKVDATKFTEVGYVGRDVEQIIRDLVDIAIHQIKKRKREQLKQKSREIAEEKVIDALVGTTASKQTKDKFLKELREGKLDQREIKIETNLNPSTSFSEHDIAGVPGMQMGMVNIGEMVASALGQNKTTRNMTVKESYDLLVCEAADSLINNNSLKAEAIELVENQGIVFIDEIDKICGRNTGGTAEVSREGVQRDMLPMIEGTNVSTKHGIVRTDHILFITSGAFHVARPSDLLPELQGRLSVRVQLKALTKDDFRRILTEPEMNLIKQYQALLQTEGVEITFDDDAIAEIAAIAAQLNGTIENIGARRLYTVMEKLLEEISFAAGDDAESKINITADYVKNNLAELTEKRDLSKFIL